MGLIVSNYGLLGFSGGKGGVSVRAAAASGGDYPTGLQPLNWWDATDLTTLWQDEAGTSAVTTTGQEVQNITDKGSSAEDMNNAPTATGPLYTTGGAEGFSYILGNNADYLNTTTGVNSWPSTNERAALMVSDFTAFNQSFGFMDGSFGQLMGYGHTDSNTTPTIWMDGHTVGDGNSNAGLVGWYMRTVSTADVFMRMSEMTGEVSVEYTSQERTNEIWNLGAQVSINPFVGKIYELALWQGTIPTAADMITYMEDKYAITF